MKTLLFLTALALLCLRPCAALSQATPMPTTMIGVGSHGYDFLIGHWNCTNSTTSPLGGSRAPFGLPNAPPAFSVVYRAEVDGSLSWVLSVNSTPNQSVGELRYASGARTWSLSYTFPSGGYGEQMTHDTGQKIVWTGAEWDANKRMMNSRDTWTFSSSTILNDLGEYQADRTWFATARITCTKP
jgi:hypothetical protein